MTSSSRGSKAGRFWQPRTEGASIESAPSGTGTGTTAGTGAGIVRAGPSQETVRGRASSESAASRSLHATDSIKKDAR
ncbi:hypothetical protein VTH06DRAFT_7470 [Thermothelomyces fergusii]